MAEQHWRVQDSSYRMPRDHKPVVLYYDPTPGGRKNDDGTTTISLNFPALALTEWVNMPEEIGKQIAAELNAFPKLVKALTDLCDEIGSKEEHGDGADDADCSTCRAHKRARKLLKALVGTAGDRS